MTKEVVETAVNDATYNLTPTSDHDDAIAVAEKFWADNGLPIEELTDFLAALAESSIVPAIRVAFLTTRNGPEHRRTESIILGAVIMSSVTLALATFEVAVRIRDWQYQVRDLPAVSDE